MSEKIKLEETLQREFDADSLNRAKTLFYKRLSFLLHSHFQGKLEVMPKVPVWGAESFSLWYTPGVSEVSCQIREENLKADTLTCKGRSVAIVSDSTRVLGDGDCTPPGGMGVMEGKALLLKYLAGVDAIPLCIDSYNEDGVHDPQKIIQVVKACSPSFAAINLEDISQPNCYTVLKKLQEELKIPVWHDDAQGTACTILAGLYNSLKLVEKKIGEVKVVLIGAGAAGSQIATYLLKAGVSPSRLFIFDQDGGLHADRKDFEDDPQYFKQWELCQNTNREKIDSPLVACQNADILIGVSAPGTINSQMVTKMNQKAIVFACANPVPEIYPAQAKLAGAAIVATGRSDFPNQINNSLVFPGLLRAVVQTGASKITDSMALVAAQAIATTLSEEELTTEKIVPSMEDKRLVPNLLESVCQEIKKEGLNKKEVNPQQLCDDYQKEISRIRDYTQKIQTFPPELIEEALQWTKEKLTNS